MANNSCRSRYNCIDIVVLVSTIIAVVAGVLRYMAVITLTPAFLWAIFGVSVGFLALLIFTTSFWGNVQTCKLSALSAILFGIVGTVLLSVVLLGITFAATSVVGAIASGLAVGFFALTIGAAVCLVKRNIVCVD